MANRTQLSEKARTVLSAISSGLSYEQIVARYPQLSYKDIFDAAKEALELDEQPENDYKDRLANIKSRYSRAYEPWTKEEDAKLTAFYKQGLNRKQIAEQLQRQPGAISSRIAKLGLEEATSRDTNEYQRGEGYPPQTNRNNDASRKGDVWSLEEEEYLMRQLNAGKSALEIAQRLRRTTGAVEMKIAKIREQQSHLPREIGKHPLTGFPITLKVGRFGLYLEHHQEMVSVPLSVHPNAITLEKAVEILKSGNHSG